MHNRSGKVLLCHRNLVRLPQFSDGIKRRLNHMQFKAAQVGTCIHCPVYHCNGITLVTRQERCLKFRGLRPLWQRLRA
jgi:hypothetical protein